jgi:uncharacterized protein (DUF1499 family)
MPFFFWLSISVVILLTVFRFWPVTGAGNTSDIFTVDHGNRPNYYQSTENEGQFNVPITALEDALAVQIAKTPRIKQTFADRTVGFCATYVERSFVFGFPDILSVKIEELSPSTAIITLHSQSKFGYSDFGVNRKRIKKLLAGLRQQLGT